MKFTALEKNDSFKVLIGIGKTGVEMKPHSADKDAFLMIQKGEIIFKLADKENYMNKDGCIKIPMNCVHSFKVIKSCEVLLILDANAKMKFVKEA